MVQLEVFRSTFNNPHVPTPMLFLRVNTALRTAVFIVSYLSDSWPRSCIDLMDTATLIFLGRCIVNR